MSETNDNTGPRLWTVASGFADDTWTRADSVTGRAAADAIILPLAPADLEGLPDFVVVAARAAAEERGREGHVLTLSRSLVVPFLQFSPRRDLRRRAYQAWVADPENGQKEADYFQARLEKDIVLKWLLRSAIDSSQYTQAATILAGEPGPRAQRWKLGLKLLAEDYTGATAALQQLPQQTQAEQYFAYIMGVNIQRLQSEGNFTLSASQENQLLEIAHSESSYRSYARSLLNLLKGALFEPDEISFEEYEEQQPFQPPASSSALKYKIYPNPTHEQILIQYPYEEAQLILDVTAVTGTFSHRIKLDGSGSYALDTQTFTPGIYIIQILKDKRVVHLDRITIIH